MRDCEIFGDGSRERLGERSRTHVYFFIKVETGRIDLRRNNLAPPDQRPLITN